jgi:hypothetical protein
MLGACALCVNLAVSLGLTLIVVVVGQVLQQGVQHALQAIQQDEFGAGASYLLHTLYQAVTQIRMGDAASICGVGCRATGAMLSRTRYGWHTCTIRPPV